MLGSSLCGNHSATVAEGVRAGGACKEGIMIEIAGTGSVSGVRQAGAGAAFPGGTWHDVEAGQRAAEYDELERRQGW